MLTKKYFFILTLLVLTPFFTELFTQEKESNQEWNELKFLEGRWVGDGKGQPGQGSGSFTFSYDLDKNVIIRKSHTEFPSKDGKTMQSHDDMIIVYKSVEGKIKAIYFDNEGHVINYDVKLTKEKNQIIFISEIFPTSPTFRLVYTKMDNDKLKTSFEIAKPGNSEVFSTYLEGISVRDKKF